MVFPFHNNRPNTITDMNGHHHCKENKTKQQQLIVKKTRAPQPQPENTKRRAREQKNAILYVCGVCGNFKACVGLFLLTTQKS
mmetsp:Transcript_6417/g.13213  ORF Transcript_6417/g.13213 Transcript_6417/m.13213 type:complete len:83 (+) Transcript_6417:460-708(+)